MRSATRQVRLNRENAPKIVGFGAVTGLFSGFFGIGGGFLIVPGLIASTGMPMLNAVGSSLVAVTAFGLTTSVNYASSGLIDWPLAAVFIAGGVVGGVVGARVAKRLSSKKGLLNTRLCQPDLRRCRLYALAKQRGAAGVRAVAAVQIATVAGS